MAKYEDFTKIHNNLLAAHVKSLCKSIITIQNSKVYFLGQRPSETFRKKYQQSVYGISYQH